MEKQKELIEMAGRKRVDEEEYSSCDDGHTLDGGGEGGGYGRRYKVESEVKYGIYYHLHELLGLQNDKDIKPKQEKQE
ncbi:hypothetical protein NIES4071_108020 (plasmid) [Calothrix sp. NIES-4071]|nr:hypothetical protein NIES4071_108020 [Calothrix sp. NIES-4071]BAZ64842.1 hypothetical protein NIES4105_105750 [Calothrix sp. NIES-4105]